MDKKILYFGLWFFAAILSIVFVMMVTNAIAKKLNFERYSNIKTQKYKISPWFFVKQMVDFGYMTTMILLPALLLDGLSAKRLIVSSLILTTVLFFSFLPYLFARREAYILISDTCFEINFPIRWKLNEKISLNQIREIDYTRKKIVLHMKEGTEKAIPRDALSAFRGHNNITEKLESLMTKTDVLSV
jgi:hypothetical protein